MGRPVVHWELWTNQPEKACAFYEQAFGWEIHHIPKIDYRLVETGTEEGIDGGVIAPREGAPARDQVIYIDVDDLAEYHERIEAAGGRVLVDRVEVLGVGDFSLFEDPEGRVMGLWQQEV